MTRSISCQTPRAIMSNFYYHTHHWEKYCKKCEQSAIAFGCNFSVIDIKSLIGSSVGNV